MIPLAQQVSARLGGAPSGGCGPEFALHPNAKPGDWLCPGCGDLQFARNFTCRRCSTPKPSGAGSLGPPQAAALPGGGPMSALLPPSPLPPGAMGNAGFGLL